jgi:hypothetical protein
MTTKTINDLAAKAQRLTYRAPETITLNATSDLVQGGGGGAGFDWWHQYFPDANGY